MDHPVLSSYFQLRNTLMSYESSPSKSRIDRLRDSLAKFGEDYTFVAVIRFY